MAFIGVADAIYHLIVQTEKTIELRKVLEMVEWVNQFDKYTQFCPWCEANRTVGHKPYCPRQKALDKVS
jgi:ribosome-associated toxin RatA of RatAB toxin-antitoxin module